MSTGATADPRRACAVAALVAATTFLFGIVMFVTVMADYSTGDPTRAESVDFIADNEAAFYLWYSVIYLLFGVALVVVVLALHDLLSAASDLTAKVATTFGVIWGGLMFAAGMVANIGIDTIVEVHGDDPDRAETVWATWDAILNGLGGGNEIVGGIWVALVSWVSMRTGRLPRALAIVGLISGVAGIVTVVPALEAVGAVFGIGLIIWFAWLGLFMLRDDAPLGGSRAPHGVEV